MKKLEVMAGVCGFRAVVTGTLRDDGQVDIEIESECDRVKQVAARLEAVDPIEELYQAGPSLVRKACAGCHATCLVPIGVLKVLEAEAGLALPRDAGLRFIE